MMKPAGPAEAVRIENLDDAGLVEHARQRDPAAFWLIIKRHNQRLHRVARAVLNDDTEAEDVLQETYIHAFTHLAEFRSEARLSTWLTRIALNEALGRRRKRRPTIDVKAIPKRRPLSLKSVASWSEPSVACQSPFASSLSCGTSRK
jgi:RNA polymerase sigma-70 factor (ECF subfamily)